VTNQNVKPALTPAEKRAKYRASPAYKAQIERQNQRYAEQRPVVYVWIAPDGKADYVGRGTEARAVSHGYPYRRKWSPWWTPEHRLRMKVCDSEWHAMEMEGVWGQFYQPRFNKEGYRHTR